MTILEKARFIVEQLEKHPDLLLSAYCDVMLNNAIVNIQTAIDRTKHKVKQEKIADLTRENPY